MLKIQGSFCAYKTFPAKGVPWTFSFPKTCNVPRPLILYKKIQIALTIPTHYDLMNNQDGGENNFTQYVLIE